MLVVTLRDVSLARDLRDAVVSRRVVRLPCVFRYPRRNLWSQIVVIFTTFCAFTVCYKIPTVLSSGTSKILAPVGAFLLEGLMRHTHLLYAL